MSISIAQYVTGELPGLLELADAKGFSHTSRNDRISPVWNPNHPWHGVHRGTSQILWIKVPFRWRRPEDYFNISKL